MLGYDCYRILDAVIQSELEKTREQARTDLNKYGAALKIFIEFRDVDRTLNKLAEDIPIAEKRLEEAKTTRQDWIREQMSERDKTNLVTSTPQEDADQYREAVIKCSEVLREIQSSKQARWNALAERLTDARTRARS